MKQTRMGRLTRRALSLLFALTLLWECGALSPKARATDVVAADGTVQFVLWQRVTAWKSRLDEGLKKYCSDGPHPLLLSYESNKTEYLMCVTKDNWRWEKKDYVLAGMPTVYDSPFDEMRGYFLWKDNFMSMSTFNSLWAQYKGTDSNGNPKMLINVSNGADGPGEYLGPGKSYGGQTYGGHKVRDTCFVVRPEETTTWRFSPGDEGARMWNRDYDGSDEDVIFHGSTVVLSDDEREDLRRVFVGYEVISASALTHDFTVQRDQATTMGRPSALFRRA